MSKNGKPSILFINRIFPPDKGATALRLFEMADFMAKKGWNVTVLAAKGRDEDPERMHENITVRRLRVGSNIHPVPFSEYPRLLAEFIWSLLWIRSHDITVTLTDPPLLSWAAMLIKPFKRTKFVHWSHDVYPELFPVLGIKFSGTVMKIMKSLTARALRKHDAVIAIGRDMADFMMSKGIPGEKITIINNWPDTFYERFNVPEKHENPFVIADRMTFLYSGNFGLAHEFEVLLQSIKLLEPKKYAVRFLFVGQGRKLEELQERVAELGLETVQFLSYQPEARVKELLDAGDVHLATMKEDALGLLMPSKVNSAFALNKPVIFIGPLQSEAARLITENNAGYAVDIHDENARFNVARIIADLILNKKIYDECSVGSAACFEKIKRDVTAGKFEKTVRSMIETKKG